MKTTSELFDALLGVALDLSTSLPTRRRYQRLVEAVNRVLPGDAVALLKIEGDAFVPVAVKGLDPSILAERMRIAAHPRFQAICGAEGLVRFPAADARPDPYDGLVSALPGQRMGGRIHSCLGAPLRVEGELIGALTVDALEPGKFDQIPDAVIETFTAIAAATMRTALLIDSLDRTVERRDRVARELVQEAFDRHGAGIVGTSPAMKRLETEIELAARSGMPVLIEGETGVGKELVARTIHARSPRAQSPLVSLNCAALPESVAESELFGHVKGAFTGAISDRPGRFEVADEGAIFLDEIGELPLRMQSLLLRAIQFGEFQRVGSSRTERVDVWVIAATNRNLRTEIAAGRFRDDLYHRVGAFPVFVPPLRERLEDIELLTLHFLDETRLKLSISRPHIHPEAIAALRSYDWPGNVRELQHVIHRAAVRASAGGRVRDIEINREHLDLQPQRRAPIAPVAQGSVGALREEVDAFQRNLIRRALAESQGNWARASRLLKVDKSNLARLADRLGVTSDKAEN